MVENDVAKPTTSGKMKYKFGLCTYSYYGLIPCFALGTQIIPPPYF